MYDKIICVIKLLYRKKGDATRLQYIMRHFVINY